MIQTIYKYQENEKSGFFYFFKIEYNQWILFNESIKTIYYKQKVDSYILKNSQQISTFDFIIHIQNVSFLEKIGFFQMYFEAIKQFLSKKRNYVVIFSLIPLLEEALEIPKKSRWSIEKLEKEKKRTK
ncbi:hypothetical protein [Fusobacterium necrophorum]|uniref:hypothetical protein n=1 Tax=Fusobacterium necrophorum TaxID=859 RepID=UPI00370E1DF1